MSGCDNCRKVTGLYHLTEANGKHLWLCDECNPEASRNGSWSSLEKITTRVRLPDGKVVWGRQGQKILDARRKAQEAGERYARH